MKSELYKEEYVKAEVDLQSLIDPGKERPTQWGNYFSLISGISIVNMWSENLEDACEKFLEDGLVKIRNYGTIAIVIDDRIPENYYYNKCCFTGAGKVSHEAIRDIYEKLGDPTNELEQFTNPEEYYKKRGGEYKKIIGKDGTSYGHITYPLKQGSKELKGGWKIETKDDMNVNIEPDAFVYCPYVPILKNR